MKKSRILRYVTIFILVLSSNGTLAVAAEIDWALRNPFPLFEDNKDFKEIFNTWCENNTQDEVVYCKNKRSAHAFVSDPVFYNNADRYIPFERTSYNRFTGKYKDTYIDISKRLTEISLWLKNSNIQDDAICTWKISYSSSSVPPIKRKCADQGFDAANPINVPYETPIHITAEIDGKLVAINTISIHDKLVLAIGDSFASGEGNPDRPAKYPSFNATYGSWFHNADSFIEHEKLLQPSQWWDRQCHRSLLSWQVLATLRLAVEDRKNSITFVSYACSGAEIIDGIFNPQIDPPGYPLSDKIENVDLSQVDAATNALCNKSENTSMDIGIDNVHTTKCIQPIRKIDALLLSIGGNDVLFGPVVKGVLLPKEAFNAFNQWFLNLFRNLDAVKAYAPEKGIEKAEDWKPHYAKAIDALLSSLGVDATKTFLLRYPDPTPTQEKLLDDNNRITRFQDNALAMSHALDLKSGFTSGWVSEFDKDEYEKIKYDFLPKIYAMQNSVNPSIHLINWDDASSTGEKFENHGMFTPPDYEEPDYFCDTPDTCYKTPHGGKDPSKWNAFKPRLSWIHLPNDSAIALRPWRYDKTEAKDMEELKGTLHPTVEAHSIAADSVFMQLQSFLNK